MGWYTAGIVGGLTTVAVTAPSDKFLYMGGPLAMGLGVVFMASLGSAFLPARTALGAGLQSISLYGGLVLFSGFMLYNTQKIIHRAENHSRYGMQKYDPVNNSIGIYMDTVNIFVRIAMILAGGVIVAITVIKSEYNAHQSMLCLAIAYIILSYGGMCVWLLLSVEPKYFGLGIYTKYCIVIILVLIFINIVILLWTDWYEYYRKGAKSKFIALPLDIEDDEEDVDDMDQENKKLV